MPLTLELRVPYCATCQTKRDGKFCFSCGTSLTEGNYLCSCGYEMWPHETFCKECGKQREDQ